VEHTLRVEDLDVTYHTRQATLTAVRNVSFTLDAGQIVGIVGESGCGKSTIASAVMRLLPPNGEITAGQVLLGGQDLRHLNEEQMRQIRGLKMSMIFQDPMTSLNPVFNIEHLMVDAIMAHSANGRATSRAEARDQAVQMLDRVGIPDAAQRIKDFPHQFSGGMRQRIMIAVALQCNPSLLIADEPTSALDVTLEAQIIDLIRALRDELQTAILYITHDLGVVAQLCDAVLVLYAGGVVELGDVRTIFQNPQHPYTRALLHSHPSRHARARQLATIRGRVPSLRELPAGCKFAPRCDFAEPICFDEEPRISQNGGHQVLCHAYRSGWKGSAPLLTEATEIATEPDQYGQEQRTERETVVRAQQLQTHFVDTPGLLDRLVGRKASSVRAVDGVSINVLRGETLALVGESGCGKTTLGRTILRLESPTDGQVHVHGQDITTHRQSSLRPMRARMQMIFQDPVSSLSPRKTVSSLLLEPFKVHGVAVDGPQKVADLLEMVGLSSEQADKYPHQLSGGQARRVGIARALALEPEVLVADEPTAGLDVSVAAGILNLLRNLRERLHLTYIIITHNLHIVGFIADRVAVMYLGKIVEIGETSALFARPKHPYTEALISAVSLPDPDLREQRKRIVLEGEIPSPKDPPSGCPFHPRCRYRQERCVTVPPQLSSVNGNARQVACHYPDAVVVGNSS
jgi:oligopeptide/dipeptide ABC transporter ATP-binding protein